MISSKIASAGAIFVLQQNRSYWREHLTEMPMLCYNR